MPKSIVLGATLLILSLPCATRTVHADTVENDSIPLEVPVFVPCANDGAGEWVLLSGPLHVMSQVNIDNQGKPHLVIHIQNQGICGHGMDSGCKYQAVGNTQEEFSFAFGEQNSFENNFAIIGQGPGNNYKVHENFHFTVNANGTLTSWVDNFKAECK